MGGNGYFGLEEGKFEIGGLCVDSEILDFERDESELLELDSTSMTLLHRVAPEHGGLVSWPAIGLLKLQKVINENFIPTDARLLIFSKSWFRSIIHTQLGAFIFKAGCTESGFISGAKVGVDGLDLWRLSHYAEVVH
jgi:hypothetical protein